MTAATLQTIKDRLDALDTEALIANACALMLSTQKDLAEESGVSPTTITEIKRGKRATKSQRSAIYWAIALRIT